MSITLRAAGSADAGVCGRICYEAFKSIAERHNFPPDFPSAEAAAGLLSMLLANPGIYAVVAERNGRVLGSNFFDERSVVGGIGPITVDPTVQDGGVGRRLMEHLLDRAAERGLAGVRLVQSAYHNRSLSLYAKLGFDVREPLSCLAGPALATRMPGYEVRPATEADLAACDRLCLRIHGHQRHREIVDAIGLETAVVVERGGRVTGYATIFGFPGHAVGESDGDVQALIASAGEFLGPGFLVPSRNTELLRWCFARGFRLVQQMTLMTIGLYNEPRGAYLPSVFF